MPTAASDIDLKAISDPALIPIAEKVGAGVRLSGDDAIALFKTSDLLGLGSMANAANRAKHGSQPASRPMKCFQRNSSPTFAR